MGEPPREAEDPRAVLERELYWAGDATSPTSQSTRELRVALHDFAATMRADERSPIPRDEPQLGSPSRWKRKTKASFYVLLRPITHRYDRLLADLLADAEAEIARLREAIEARDSERPGGREAS